MASASMSLPISSDSDRAGSWSNILSALRPSPSPSASQKKDQLEYLFEDEYQHNGMTFGARLCYGVGSSYLAGSGVGVVWGTVDGLRNDLFARGSTRLRLNCLLNGVTARGPFVGNSAAILALMYNGLHGGLLQVVGGEREGVGTAVGAAAAAGALFKSTRGLAAMGRAAAVLGTASLVFKTVQGYQRE